VTVQTLKGMNPLFVDATSRRKRRLCGVQDASFWILERSVEATSLPGRSHAFYSFAWLFRWSRKKFVADQRKARTRS